jgi:PAS domain
MVERLSLLGTTQNPTRVVVDPGTIEQRALAELLAYWRLKRGDQRIPRYEQFSPREIARHLGSVVVADAMPDCTNFRYRLVGSRVTRYFLSDATGKFIDQEFEGELGQFLVALNRQACVESVPIRLTGPAAIIDGTLFPNYDTLYLPWAAGEGGFKVISIFAFDEGGLAARSIATDALPSSYDAVKIASADDLVRERKARGS